MKRCVYQKSGYFVFVFVSVFVFVFVFVFVRREAISWDEGIVCKKLAVWWKWWERAGGGVKRFPSYGLLACAQIVSAQVLLV